MVNTKEGKDKRAVEYEQRGFVLGTERAMQEPYITWNQLVMAMLASQQDDHLALLLGNQIHRVIEESLQLSENEDILNNKEENE